jgi:hypothetical protein
MAASSTQVKTLDKAFYTQRKTIDALKNINEDLLDCEEGGNVTLEELKRQNYKLNDILEETDRLDDAQAEARRLQNRLGRWAMKFGGGSKESRIKPPKKTPPSKGGSATKHGNSSTTGKSTMSSKHKNSERASYVESGETDVLHGISILKETHASELKDLAQNDREIEGLLDNASTTLSHLAALQTTISNEIHASTDTINVIESNLETAGYKQRRLNARGLNFLEGKYRQRA